MDCPNNHTEKLRKVLFHNVEADYCPECLGLWFDKTELARAKDEKDSQLNWVDFDLWRDTGRLTAVQINKKCPVCSIPLVEVGYDQSKVNIDFCKKCEGVWLDRGEFKQIILYLMRKSDYEVLHHYTKNLAKQFFEIFTGPQNFKEELSDFFMLLKLLNYKFVAQHPNINKIIENLPK